VFTLQEALEVVDKGLDASFRRRGTLMPPRWPGRPDLFDGVARGLAGMAGEFYAAGGGGASTRR